MRTNSVSQSILTPAIDLSQSETAVQEFFTPLAKDLLIHRRPFLIFVAVCVLLTIKDESFHVCCNVSYINNHICIRSVFSISSSFLFCSVSFFFKKGRFADNSSNVSKVLNCNLCAFYHACICKSQPLENKKKSICCLLHANFSSLRSSVCLSVWLSSLVFLFCFFPPTTGPRWAVGGSVGQGSRQVLIHMHKLFIANEWSQHHATFHVYFY